MNKMKSLILSAAAAVVTAAMLKVTAEAMTVIMIMQKAMVIGTKVTAEVIKAPSILHHY